MSMSQDWYTRFGSRLMFHGSMPKGIDGSGRRLSFEPGSLGTYVMLSDPEGSPIKVLPKTTCPNDIAVWGKYLKRHGLEQGASAAMVAMMRSIAPIYSADVMVERVLDAPEEFDVDGIADALVGWMGWQPRKDHVRNGDGTQVERSDCHSLAYYLDKVNASKSHVPAPPPKKPKATVASPPTEPGKRRFTL